MTAAPGIPTWQQFVIDSVQIALFTPDNNGRFSANRATAAILRRFADHFDGEMQVVPLSDDAPREIPWIVLQGRDNRCILQIGPGRFDLIRNQEFDCDTATVSDYVRSGLEIAEHYVRETDAGVGRLALVARRVCPHQQPAEALIERFCNEAAKREPLNRSSTFELHNHKEYRPAADGIDYRVNSWVRCKCAAMQPDGRPAILVLQDLNTLTSDAQERRFSLNELHKFFDVATVEVDKIMSRYFPE